MSCLWSKISIFIDGTFSIATTWVEWAMHKALEFDNLSFKTYAFPQITHLFYKDPWKCGGDRTNINTASRSIILELQQLNFYLRINRKYLFSFAPNTEKLALTGTIFSHFQSNWLTTCFCASNLRSKKISRTFSFQNSGEFWCGEVKMVTDLQFATLCITLLRNVCMPHCCWFFCQAESLEIIK